MKDIYSLEERLENMERLMNVRSLISALMDKAADGDPEVWVTRLREATEEADTTLEALNKIRESLDLLECELGDTLWVLGA